MRKLFLSAAALILLAASGAIASREAMDESAVRAASVALAKRQAQMWEAAVKSDWEALYGMVSPQARKKVSLLRYMENPYTPAPLTTVNISGAATLLEEEAEGKKLIADGKAPRYQPPILNYRFLEMRFSPDGRRALVASSAAISAEQVIGPTSSVASLYGLWVKDDGGTWYADLAATALIHTSGAATGNDPLKGLSVKVDPASLAAALVEEARSASGGDADALLDEALWLDTLQTARRAKELHMGSPELFRVHLDRVFSGAWKMPHIYPGMMEAAYWYSLIGEDDAALRAYTVAAAAYPGGEDARAGAALAAVRLGRWDEAAEHYLHLLGIGAATGGALPPTLESYLSPECRLCEKIPAATGLAIASRLCNRRDYPAAAAVYRFYAMRHPGFAAALDRLKGGKELTLVELLGDELARESAGLTYHDAAGLLEALGLRLVHPDDAPVGASLPPGGVTLRSVPRLERASHGAGYSSWVSPAAGEIRGAGSEVSQKLLEKEGWLIAAIDEGALRGDLHRDGPNGENPGFAGAVRKLKKGETLFAVRVGNGPYTPDAETLKALETAGVDAATLPKSIFNLVLTGVKGGKKGSARVFASDIAVLKSFDPAARGKSGAVSVKGFGPEARVRLAR